MLHELAAFLRQFRDTRCSIDSTKFEPSIDLKTGAAGNGGGFARLHLSGSFCPGAGRAGCHSQAGEWHVPVRMDVERELLPAERKRALIPVRVIPREGRDGGYCRTDARCP
jgi:hypothetical protein